MDNLKVQRPRQRRARPGPAKPQDAAASVRMDKRRSEQERAGRANGVPGDRALGQPDQARESVSRAVLMTPGVGMCIFLIMCGYAFSRGVGGRRSAEERRKPLIFMEFLEPKQEPK